MQSMARKKLVDTLKEHLGKIIVGVFSCVLVVIIVLTWPSRPEPPLSEAQAPGSHNLRQHGEGGGTNLNQHGEGPNSPNVVENGNQIVIPKPPEWYLTDDQKTKLIEVLSKFPGTRADVWANPGPENRIHRDLYDAFVAAKWIVGNGSTALEPYPTPDRPPPDTAIKVLTKTGSTVPAADALFQTLRDMGFNVTHETNENVKTEQIRIELFPVES